MAYSDYTLEKAIEKLGIHIQEDRALFASVAGGEISTYLKMTLDRKTAFSISSEKARSEMIIAPILDDVFSVREDRLAIFSGENFDVDKELKLKGLADYLICLSSVKTMIQAPVIAVAESIKYDPVEGLGQCLAELYASALFNERKNKTMDCLFGVSTSGSEWLFGRYEVRDKIFTYNPTKYSLDRLPHIVGVLAYMRDEALRMYDKG